MAPAEGDAALAASASRQRGRRKRAWAAVLCFVSRGARVEEALVASSPWTQRKRTGQQVAQPDDCEARRGADEEAAAAAGKGTRARGCCFLPPARVPAGRRDSTMESGGGSSNTNRKHRQHEHTTRKQARPQDDENQPSQAPDARQVQTSVAPATTGVADEQAPTRLPATPCDAAIKNAASARECSAAAGGGGGHGATAGSVGAFGPAVGLSVVAAVSMAGLLGGRLWAVACVCSWLVAFSRLRRRHTLVSAGGTAGGDVEEVVMP